MNAFTGVKVFTASMFAQRRELGEVVTDWLRDRQRQPDFEVVDRVVRQSSDRAFHCISIILFFREGPSTSRADAGASTSSRTRTANAPKGAK